MMGTLEHALAPFGMIVRGGFALTEADLRAEKAINPFVGEDRGVILIGNAGPAMGKVFKSAQIEGLDPLDRWTRQVLDPLAKSVGGRALYPFQGPPYLPFLRWAQRAEPVFPSPIGMMIHPDFGLWHAYRAAFVFDRDIPIPQRSDQPSPCETCLKKPCLTMCPVSAFGAEGYAVQTCREHLRTLEGNDCMAEGCRARRACPVGKASYWGEEMASFHMQAFRR